jgi:hypothetical protein
VTRRYTSVVVSIDKTPPSLTGHPADGEVEHNPRAPIAIQYSDELSGVDASGLQVILDTDDISLDFQHYSASGAIYVPPQDLALGSHSWEVTLGSAGSHLHISQTGSCFNI